MFVVAGLGNPGRRYADTRHNIGFMTVDRLAEKLDIKIEKLRNKALVGEGNLAGQKILMVKPQTYMNLSGESIQEIRAYYKIDPENILVIYDDVDIPRGTIRIRKKGGPGTHNGMRSVVSCMGAEGFPRIRIGIGSDTRMRLMDYVTGRLGKEEKKILDQAADQAAEAVICIIKEGIDKAMNRYNGNIQEG